MRKAYSELDGPRRMLALMGTALLLLGLAHGVVWLVAGGPVLGPVSWRKPTLFASAIGGILLATLWASMHIRMSRKLTWVLLGGLSVGGLIQAGLVVIQRWRGTASHFNVFTTDTNAVMALVIALTTLPVTVMFVTLMILSYRRNTASGTTRFIVRYGFTMVAVGTVEGLTMIAHAMSTIPSRIKGMPQPPFVWGEAGILVVPHLVALHGLLFAITMGAISRRVIRDEGARYRFLLGSCGVYTTLFLLQLYQTYSGLKPWAISGAAAAATVALMALCIFAIPRLVPSRLSRAAVPLMLVVAATTSCALPEPVDGVGMDTIVVTDSARNRKFAIDMWYPSDDAHPDWYRPVPLVRPVFVSRGAKPAAGKHPLVLISHGALGFRYAQAWLAEQLASKGYIVAALDHPGSMRGNLTGEGMFTLWNRALDVTFAIDQLLADKRWSSLIDASKIGFNSHSAGGHTGLLLAGGHFDPRVFRAYRDTNPSGDIYAKELKQYDALEATIDATPYQKSYRDARIGAFLLMAPSPVTGFDAKSLQQITAPVRIYASKRDEINPLEAHALFAAHNIPGASLRINDAGHFVYVVGGSIFGKRAIPSIFDDASDIDRTRMQAELAIDASNFFDDKLGH